MKKKKKLIIILAIILIIAALLSYRAFIGSKNNIKTVNVTAAAKNNLVQTISLSGNIQANETEEIVLSPSQKVIQVSVSEGQEITKSQLLIKLDTFDLENQLKKGRISLELAKKELDKLKDTENGTARKSAENAVKQAELGLESAKSKYKDANTRHEQNTKLYEAGFLSKEDFEASKSTLNDLQTNIENMEITLDNAKNSLQDFDDRIYQQQKQIEISTTDLVSLEKRIADSSIKANINGKIVKIDARKNQYPQAGSSILIYDQSLYKLALKASQYDAVKINEGQKAEIKIKGLDKIYTGTVSKVGESAIIEMAGVNKETKVLVEIALENGDESIKAGYEADAELVLEEKQGTVSINFEALQTDVQDKHYVFIIENQTAKKRFVETGLETDFEIEIISGLTEGEKYITSPPAELKDGETVTILGGM